MQMVFLMKKGPIYIFFFERTFAQRDTNRVIFLVCELAWFLLTIVLVVRQVPYGRTKVTTVLPTPDSD